MFEGVLEQMPNPRPGQMSNPRPGEMEAIAPFSPTTGIATQRTPWTLLSTMTDSWSSHNIDWYTYFRSHFGSSLIRIVSHSVLCLIRTLCFCVHFEIQAPKTQ